MCNYITCSGVMVLVSVAYFAKYDMASIRPNVNRHGPRKLDHEVFVEHSTYARHMLKKRILQQSLIEYRCDCCGMDPEWEGKDLVLILDHINGVNNDNRLDNLRFVCPNCDSQLPTYKSGNRRVG